MKNLLIGVTPRILMDNGNKRVFVNDVYVEAMRKRNANVIMLTIDNPNIDEILDLCDGIIVTGGGDMDPACYGENNDEGLSTRIFPELDELDKKVIEYAIRNNKPMLGICRGIQTINVYMGGSLYQDIPNHRGIEEGHEVIIYKNPILDLDELILTNSYHHQAIKDLADGFNIFARHVDGTVEGIYSTLYPVIGVQWHPEEMQESPSSKIIFDKFFEYINRK